MSALPDKLHALVRASTDNGFNALINHGMSSGDAPFVTVRLRNHDHDIHAAWHTAKTGTYRWDGAVVDNRQSGVSYRRVLELVQEPPRDHVR